MILNSQMWRHVSPNFRVYLRMLDVRSIISGYLLWKHTEFNSYPAFLEYSRTSNTCLFRVDHSVRSWYGVSCPNSPGLNVHFWQVWNELHLPTRETMGCLTSSNAEVGCVVPKCTYIAGYCRPRHDVFSYLSCILLTGPVWERMTKNKSS